MGQRPSQCVECGCFTFCLSPTSARCAERFGLDPAVVLEAVDADGNPVR